MQRSKFTVSLLAAGAALVAVIAPVSAADAEMKIGVVNFQKLFNESPQAGATKTALANEFRTRQRDLETQAKDFKAKAEKFQRDSSIMAEAERTKVQRELLDTQRDLQRRENELKEDLELRNNEELQKVQRVLIAEVQAFGKAQGFDMIVSADTVIYRKDSIDVTAQIVGMMHEKNSKAGAAAPAAKP